MRTTNQILIALPLDRVAELYTCHELLPSWSPGFISLEYVSGERGAVDSVFRHRYVVKGQEIEDITTLVAIDWPNGYRILSNCMDKGYRESTLRFEALDPTTTRITVHNLFSGEYVPHLVQEELQAYVEQHLETFKTFAESRSKG